MMQFGYSEKTNAFYFMDEEDAYRGSGFWQEDIIPVTDEIWREFVSEALSGKKRGADAKGHPCWIDLPPLSADECRKHHLLMKKEKLNEALEEIRKLEIISGITNLTSSDNAKLVEWKNYLQKIYHVSPEETNVTWPEKPEDDS
ncbi:tail fiber assembly protein [Pantoea sp. EA-12]|uniref:tail fiber assembly protein n=1 Tax=Pantoea sp. EA-12 TaxID=3043303 RepID=UPI0024B5283A|nr:tail fiber assembly protein [Pantoea sp. EA-12]MDI9222505.1 tail fiber assembly protein [Pantoea sp. EA-12]